MIDIITAFPKFERNGVLDERESHEENCRFDPVDSGNCVRSSTFLSDGVNISCVNKSPTFVMPLSPPLCAMY